MVRTAEVPHVIYLHGLGSSPDSVKARLVSTWCAELGIPVTIPSLSIPSFERLSVNAVVARVAELVRDAASESKVLLAGSSFGGFAAVHAFDRLDSNDRMRVWGMFLMAPVFYPWHKTRGLLTHEVEQTWRTRGVYPITESSSGKDVLVHYDFIEELRGYASDSVRLSVPTIIIHGTRDETVSHEQSEEFAAKQNDSRLVLVEDDHQLIARPELLRGLFEKFVGVER